MHRPHSVDELLDEARRRLQRVTAAEARAALVSGQALVVDIRPTELRARDGLLPGAVVIDRNVLEWRLDPASPDRIPQMTDHERTLILVCDEGYASSLAAAGLHDLGLAHATDLIGGIQAWIAEGFPVEPFDGTHAPAG